MGPTESRHGDRREAGRTSEAICDRTPAATPPGASATASSTLRPLAAAKLRGRASWFEVMPGVAHGAARLPTMPTNPRSSSFAASSSMGSCRIPRVERVRRGCVTRPPLRYGRRSNRIFSYATRAATCPSAMATAGGPAGMGAGAAAPAAAASSAHGDGPLPSFKLSRRRRVRNLRDRVWLLFEDPTSSTAASVVAFVVIGMIVLSTTAFVVQTLPQFVFTPNPAWDAIEKGTIAGACAARGVPARHRACAGPQSHARAPTVCALPSRPHRAQSSPPSSCCAPRAARPPAPS